MRITKMYFDRTTHDLPEYVEQFYIAAYAKKKIRRKLTNIKYNHGTSEGASAMLT